MANQKLRVKKEAKAAILERRANEGKSIVFDGRRALGTEMNVIEGLSTQKFTPTTGTNAGKEVPFDGWKTDRMNRSGNPTYLTINGLAAYTNNKQADWEWMPGKSANDAFALKSKNDAAQLDEMEDFCTADKTIVVVGRAFHPRFKEQAIYAYGQK